MSGHSSLPWFCVFLDFICPLLAEVVGTQDESSFRREVKHVVILNPQVDGGRVGKDQCQNNQCLAKAHLVGK